MPESALVPAARTLRWWDAVVVIYLVLFGVLAVVVASRVWALGELNRGFVQAADALDVTARAIALVGRLPVVGDTAGELSGSVAATAGQIRTSGLTARADLRTLAVAIGITIALLPGPLLVAYVPLRLARRRELRGLRRRLAGELDPALVEHLARAALRRVPYAELRCISPQPWRDVAQGRHIPLAAAELRRLGLRPPPGWTPPEPTHGHG